MKTSIALIGFMGTGKSVVGNILAEELQKQFIELDEFIEESAGKSVTEIFNDGEIAFRELEINTVKEIAGIDNQVIACGGGVVLNRINIDRLQQKAVVVYLKASIGVILKRTIGGSRPLLNVDDRRARIRELLEFRRPFYERAADMTINTTAISPAEVARQIMEKLKEDESLHFEK